ncbi:MAG: flagellar basal body P-ring formation chaperone FlgA [Acidobacteriota bacterium]
MRTPLASLAVILAVVARPGASTAPVAPVPLVDRVGAAMVEAVASRMGDAHVIVEHIEIFNVADAPTIEAVPGPDARAGQVVQFTLLAPSGTGTGARVINLGRATALVRVEAPHARAARMIPRGKAIDADDLEESTADVPGVPLRRLPTRAELSGGRALRNLAPGEIVTGAAMSATPAVRSGQLVRARVLFDGVEVSAMVVAAQNGDVGAVIRAFNRESRRELRVKVVSDGLVEVTHE